MFLRSLSVQNFRSYLEKTEFENLKNVTILIGPNGAGKSNFINSLLFLRDLFTCVVDTQIHSETVFDHDAKKNIEIQSKWELSEEERQQIVSKINNPNKIFEKINFNSNQIFKYITYKVTVFTTGITSEKLFFSGPGGEEIISIEGFSTGGKYNYRAKDLDSFFAANSTLDQLGKLNMKDIVRASRNFKALNGVESHEHNKFGNFIAEFFKEIKLVPAYRKATTSLEAGEEHKLNGDGANLVRVLNTKSQNKKVEFDRINEVYKKISQGAEISSPLTGKNVTVNIQEKGLTTPTNIKDMSTGFEQSLILLCDVETLDSNEAICIEEPEIHLHADSQRELFNAILDRADNRQFFITTHSPIFTQLGKNVKTILVSKPEGHSQVYEIKNEENLKIIKQQLGLRHSDVYDHDAVIFIEGDSENIAFPIVANSLGYLNDGEYKIFNLKGKGNVKNIKQLLEYLKDSDRNLFLILDNDSQVKNDIEDLDRANYIAKSNTLVLNKDFEDLFESKLLVEALKKSYPDITITLSDAEIDSQRSSQKTVEIINSYLQTNHQIELQKTRLAQEIATIIEQEIGSSGQTSSEFGNIIKNCMNVLGINPAY